VELVFQLLELGLGLLENNSKFSTIFIVGLLNATAVNVGFSLISMYAELYFHAPKIYIGLLSSIRAFATLLMAVPLGILSDRWGRKPVVTLSLLLGLTSLTTLFVAQDISMLAVSTLAGGVMWAAFGPSMQALIADISSPANAGKLVGLYTIAPSVGMFLAPMIGSLLLGLMTMRDIFLLASMISIIAVGLCVVGIKAPRRSFSTTGTLEGLWNVVKNRAVVTMCFAISTFFFLNEPVYTFYPVYALETLHLQPAVISAVLTARSLAMVLSRVISVANIVDKVGEKKMILTALSSLSTLVLMLFARDSITSAILLILTGAVHGIIYPMGAMMVAKTTTVKEKGVANAFYMMLTNTATAIGPMVAGAMTNFLGLAEIFALLPIFTTIGAIMTLLFVK